MASSTHHDPGTRSLWRTFLTVLSLSLLSGLAGYGWTRARQENHETERDGKMALPGTVDRSAVRDRSFADFDTAFAEADAECDRLAEAHRAELAAMDTSALKQRILDLIARRKFDPSVDAVGEERNAISPLDELVRALGQKDHAEGLAWVEKNLPEKREKAIAGWAVTDPHGALEHLLNSSDDGSRPSTPRTLMWVLSKEADSGPEALRAAVDHVPWDRFDDRTDLYLMSLPHVLDQTSYRAWVDSGAALSLAEQGVQIRGLFIPWFKDDPGAALSAWAGWPETNGMMRDDDFGQMLNYALNDENAGSHLKAAVEADPAVAQKVFAAVTRMTGQDSELEDWLRRDMPELLPASPPGESSQNKEGGQ